MPMVIHGDILCVLRLNFTTRLGKHCYENLSITPQEFDNCDSDHHCYYPTSLKPVYFGMIGRIWFELYLSWLLW